MDGTIALALAGDVMLGRLVNSTIAMRGFAYPWGDVLPRLQGADLVLVNLECALTAQTRRWRDGEDKAFYFRADPAAVETLRIAGVDLASVANNHAGDFGLDGLMETLRVLDQAGIAHAGAGGDLAAARRPAQIAANGWRIRVLAFADYPRQWAATATSPGINYTPVSAVPAQFAEIERSIAAAREDADLLIFSIHWGPNMRARPTAVFRDFARRVIDAGADLFWGHSAHVVQGIEWWREKPILYDTGDFVDDYAVDDELRNDLSALFLVRVRPPHVEGIELIPVEISRMQVNLARGAERDWFVQRITSLCDEMGTRVLRSAQALVVPPPEGAE